MKTTIMFTLIKTNSVLMKKFYLLVLKIITANVKYKQIFN